MWTSTIATEATKVKTSALAAELAGALATALGAGRTLDSIASEAGMSRRDLERWLGPEDPDNVGEYPFHASQVDLATAVAISSGIGQTVSLALAASLDIDPDSLADGADGVPYTDSVESAGGADPVTYEVSNGSLPTGLSMDSAGDVTGTPTVPGTFGFTVRATDDDGVVDAQNFSLTITA